MGRHTPKQSTFSREELLTMARRALGRGAVVMPAERLSDGRWAIGASSEDGLTHIIGVASVRWRAVADLAWKLQRIGRAA